MQTPGKGERTFAPDPGRFLVLAIVGVLVAVAIQRGALSGFLNGRACPDGRTCIPEAGISFVLAPGWAQISPTHSDQRFVAAWNGNRAGPGIILRRARDVLGSEPADLETLEVTANDVRTGVPGELSFVWSSASARVMTPIGPAVRIEFVDNSLILTQAHCVDHWFFSNGHAWVFTYVVVGGTYGGGGLEGMINSLALLEPSP